MQEFCYVKGKEECWLSLPEPSREIMPEVQWGDPCALFTPAYWYTQYVMRDADLSPFRHRIGETLPEEVAVCLLGGHGILAEIGNAAFDRLKREGLIRDLCDDCSLLENVLREPILIAGRRIRYRFWKQKARYLSGAFRRLKSDDWLLEDPVKLRNRLVSIPGIGHKTASWIVRNWMNSDAVAILDIHVIRAGMLMNLYRPTDKVEKQYLYMEAKFIALAESLRIPTADLDALIWSMMRNTPRLVSKLLQDFSH